MVSDKDNVRRLLRERRDAMPPDERARLSARIWDELETLLRPEHRRVASYAAVRSEVQTEGLFGRLRGRGLEVHYPRCRREDPILEFVPVEDPAALRPGTFGIPEPVGEPVAVVDLDLVLVPGLAFDRCGGRLGYGKGYYDHTLAGYAGTRVGLAFGTQIVATLPRQAHDQLMDAVVTDEGVLLATASSPEAPCQT